MHKVKAKGRKRTNQAAFDMILEGGKAKILVLKKAWKLKTPPGAYLLRKYLGKEYEVRTLEDNSGWIVSRV